MRRQLSAFQVNELTEAIIYDRLADIEKDASNKTTLAQIASEERKHYAVLAKLTGEAPKPNKLRARWYVFLAHAFGLTFAIKLMESGEKGATLNYSDIDVPEVQALAKDEDEHEHRLIGLINEERLSYMGSVVLGLNDALVEFTGALAGFTLALGDNPKLIALTGSITGIAAALSMASSEYLATKSDDSQEKHPFKASLYTGVAYLITVIALVSPYIFCPWPLISLAIMLVAALAIIALFNFYYAVAKGESFRRRFLEMAALSFGVAGISFLIGYLLKVFTGIEA